MKVYFVGMHNKPGMEPLDSRTISGKMIDAVIKELPFECTKTNLCEVEYMPTNWNDINEFGIAWGEKYPREKTDVVVLLGKWVQGNYFWNDCNIVNLPHPASCMGKDKKEEFVKNAIRLIKQKEDK